MLARSSLLVQVHLVFDGAKTLEVIFHVALVCNIGSGEIRTTSFTDIYRSVARSS